MVQGLKEPYEPEIELMMQNIYDLFKNSKPKVYYLVIINDEVIDPSVYIPLPQHPKARELFHCPELMRLGLLRTNQSKSDTKWFSAFFLTLTQLLQANYNALVVIVDGYICDIQQIPSNGMDLVIEEEIIVRFPEEFL